jgi:hypothetical protein
VEIKISKSKKNQIEFSKKLMNQARIETCVLTLIVIYLSAFHGFDSTLGITILSLTWAKYSACVALYLNKSKFENINKGRIDFLKFKLEKTKDIESVNSELDEIDSGLKNQLDEISNEEIKIDSNI